MFGLNFRRFNIEMIEGEQSEAPSNATIDHENVRKLQGKSRILPANVHVEIHGANDLKVDCDEGSTEVQVKLTQGETRHCESLVESDALQSNTTGLSTKELLSSIPGSSNASTILPLSENTIHSNDAPLNENNHSFDVRTLLPAAKSSLLDALIHHTHKDEILVKTTDNADVLDTANPNQEEKNSVILIDSGTKTTSNEAKHTETDKLMEDLGDLPPWAARLKGCERLGDSYRGYVHTEAELDMLLSLHKEQTHSSWGTRQSPSSHKPSVRFMWKSQYVPYDGIPFLNSGRRATVMECQYGPRRKGIKVKIECNENDKPVKKAHRPTCPARIYIKRVRKFPEYKIEKRHEGTAGLRLAQERALTALRVACLESKSEERFYIQFPLEIAHDYHHDDEDMIPNQTLSLLPTQVNLGSSRLDSRVVNKINELVARGVTDIYQVKHGVVNFVEKDLFLSADESVPARHNKLFFPTVTDLQNHIHQALLALESGTLESLPPPEHPLKDQTKDEPSSKRKRKEPRRVRTAKTPIRTLCIRTDDPMELTRDSISLQDAQGGHVYLMVPSASSLFGNPDTLISPSIQGDNAASSPLVQVLTVPASTSPALIEQQVDGTLNLTSGQYLALPVVNCDNQQVSTSQTSGIIFNDQLEKQPISVLSMENMTHTSSAIGVVPSPVTMAITTSSTAIEHPSNITMTASHFQRGISDTEINHQRTNTINAASAHNISTLTDSTNTTVMPDLVITPTIPITPQEMLTSLSCDLNSDKSLDLQVTSTEVTVTSSGLLDSGTLSNSSVTSGTPLSIFTSPSATGPSHPRYNATVTLTASVDSIERTTTI